MQKHLLLTLLAVLSISCGLHAQTAQDRFQLASMTASDKSSHSEYTYNDKGQLIKRYRNFESEETYDELKYNEKGWLTKMEGFEKKGSEWSLLYYIDYTHDEKGNITSKKYYNYNEIKKEMIYQGVKNLSYDNDGRLVKLEHDLDGIGLYTREEYTYDAQGRLSEILLWGIDLVLMDGELIKEELTKITYDSEGRREKDVLYTLENDNQSVASIREYTYEGMDCIEMKRTSSKGVVVNKEVYAYNTKVPAKNVILPETPEFGIDNKFGIGTMRTRQELWKYDFSIKALLHVHDLEYTYTTPTAIAQPTSQDVDTVVYSYVEGDKLYLRGGLVSEISLFDTMGQQIISHQSVTGNSIDIATIPAGSYILSIVADGSQHIRKISIQR